MPTGWTRPAGVPWIDRHHDPAAPSLLVFKLTTELTPPLIENASIQARLGADVSSRLLDRPRPRPGHIPYPQILDHDARVVLAERCGEFVQVIAPDVADPGMELLDAGLGLDPVAGELLFAAHDPLIPRELLCMALERIDRSVDLAGGQGGEVRHTHVHADDACGRVHWLLHLALGLDAHEPFAAAGRHGDVLHLAKRRTAVAVAQPTELGEKDAAVGLIELDLFRIWIAEAVGLALLLETREVGPFGEEIGVGTLQILERLLQRMRRRIGQPWCLLVIAPFGEQLAQPSIAELLLATLVLSSGYTESTMSYSQMYFVFVVNA